VLALSTIQAGRFGNNWRTFMDHYNGFQGAEVAQ